MSNCILKPNNITIHKHIQITRTTMIYSCFPMKQCMHIQNMHTQELHYKRKKEKETKRNKKKENKKEQQQL